MVNSVLKLLEYLWALLPNRVKIHFIQSRNNIGFLDTPQKDIRMRLESMDSLNRLHSCKKEPETIKWLDGQLRKDDILFDVGANVGAYSLYAARVIGVKVYSFEPSPSTFRLLLENIHLNKLSEKIIPFNIPLSSSSEMKIFKYSSLDSGSASHAGLEESETPQATINQPVLTVTLDDLISRYQIEQPNHIKIDVDGHELDILKGAMQVLQNPTLKSVQIELTKKDHNYNTIVDLLLGLRFKIDRVNQHPNSSVTDIVFTK